MTNLSTLSLVPVINATATYHALNDFTHIAYIGGAPVVLGRESEDRRQDPRNSL